MIKKENVHEGHRERMRIKLLRDNANSLFDHELLEILLFYTIPRRNTNELAHHLIQTYGTLANVLKADPTEMRNITGVSMKTASLLKLFQELVIRYNELVRVPKTVTNTTDEMRQYFEQFMTDAPEEELYIAYMNEAYEIFACERVAVGSSGMVSTTMKDLILNIQRKNPKKIALSHNHPFATCNPSRRDISSTFRIKIFLRFLNIEVVDHIIFGEDGYCSLINLIDIMCNKFDDTFHNVSSNFDTNKYVQFYGR